MSSSFNNWRSSKNFVYNDIWQIVPWHLRSISNLDMNTCYIERFTESALEKWRFFLESQLPSGHSFRFYNSYIWQGRCNFTQWIQFEDHRLILQVLCSCSSRNPALQDWSSGDDACLLHIIIKLKNAMPTLEIELLSWIEVSHHVFIFSWNLRRSNTSVRSPSATKLAFSALIVRCHGLPSATYRSMTRFGRRIPKKSTTTPACTAAPTD